MNILIHALAIKKSGGSTRHLKNFISALGEADRENKYFLCVNKALDIKVETSNVEVLRFDSGSIFSRVYLDLIGIRKVVQKYDIDLILAILNFGPIFPLVKQINFQRGPTYFCNYYLGGLNLFKKIEVNFRRKWLHLTMKASEIVVTPTTAMKGMIQRFYPDIADDKFRVIPHAIDKEGFKDCEDLPESIQRRLEMTAEDDIRILYIGHLMPYKGHDFLIQIAGRLRETASNFKFIVTMAREDWPEGYEKIIEEIKELNLSNYFLILDRVPENSVANLYKSCDIFVFPSLCESFGFPMTEAMSFGMPIIAADTLVNREICGDGALYYNPLDTRGAANKLKLLIDDAELRNSLSKKSLKQFETSVIGWHEYVLKIVELINKIRC